VVPSPSVSSAEIIRFNSLDVDSIDGDGLLSSLAIFTSFLDRSEGFMVFSIDKRVTISNTIKHYLSVNKKDALYSEILHSGIEQKDLDEWISVRIKEKTNADPQLMAQIIDKLFSIGGIVSGGMALSYITGKFNSKDVDFYFKNDISYIQAQIISRNIKHIDICMYLDRPCELHDLGVVMCTLSDVKVHIEPECNEALNSGISSIKVSNVIYPDRTISRMFKYNNRLGIKYKPAEIIYFCSIYNVNNEIFKELMKLT